MAFSTGSSSGASAEINVTPLIDVLLVLLIIFMVLVPVMPHGLAALVPQPPREHVTAAPDEPIVVQVKAVPGGGVRYAMNQQEMSRAALASEMSQLFAGRQEKVMFVRGDRDLQFSEVADVIGLGHAANADRIGILTAEMQAGK